MTQPNITRALTAGEIALARQVFGAAINYDKVRIAVRCLPLQPKNGGMCTGNTINISGTARQDDYNNGKDHLKSFFIHEMTHIWQFQKSPLYLGKKYAAELIKHRFNYMAEAYKYTLDDNKKFDDYGLEQQACIVQDYFALKFNHGHGVSRECQNKELDVAARLKMIEKLIAPHFPVQAQTPPTPRCPPPKPIK